MKTKALNQPKYVHIPHTVLTLAGVAQQRQQQFCKLPGIAPRECKSLRRPHFASVVKL